MSTVKIFSDGACRGNPGPGGWAVLLRWDGMEESLYGAEPATTNNQMELMAAIRGLESVHADHDRVIVTTDSRYVCDGATLWLKNWKARNWQTVAKKPVKNQQLWQRLDRACRGHTVRWEWVKGHSGHEENERVDRLANQAIDSLLRTRR